MNLESIVKIYNDNEDLGIEYLLAEVSRRFELSISRGAIKWFCKDLRNKNANLSNITLEYRDNKFNFISNNNTLFQVSMKKYDRLNTNDSMLRTTLFPNLNDNISFSISNDKFVLGRNGLYEDLSNEDFQNYRYISVDSKGNIDYEAYVDKKKQKVEKNYYSKNGEISSKFYYKFELKDIKLKDIAYARNKIYKYIDEEMPKIKNEDIDCYFNDLGDQFYYDIELIKKVEDYNEIYINENSTFKIENNESSIIEGITLNNQKNSNENYLAISNSYIPDIKLLCVFDFVLENKLNKKINKLSLMMLQKWFNELDIDTLNNEEKLVNALENEIDSLEYSLFKETQKNKNLKESSFSIALIGKENTYIENFGNTRVYKVKNESLDPITIDNTNVWDNYLKNIFTFEEASQYQKGSYITKYFGDIKNILNNRNTIKIDNNSYDKLLLFTDGVTYNINNKSINSIIVSNSNHELLKEIVNEACNKQVRSRNVTGCCYIKK